MNTVLVVAPHPDDETLGCGGALLRHVAAGDAVHWMIVTRLTEEDGSSAAAIRTRADEVARVASAYPLTGVHDLGLPEMRLDALSLVDLVRRMAEVVRGVGPRTLYLPHRGDAHSDHRVCFDAAAACTKWFRFPTVRRVLSYETLSETGLGLARDGAFEPNVFVDISAHLERKLEILGIYASELGAHPFPRSEAAIRALAMLRGAASGCGAAEGLLLLREIR